MNFIKFIYITTVIFKDKKYVMLEKYFFISVLHSIFDIVELIIMQYREHFKQFDFSF